MSKIEEFVGVIIKQGFKETPLSTENWYLDSFFHYRLNNPIWRGYDKVEEYFERLFNIKEASFENLFKVYTLDVDLEPLIKTIAVYHNIPLKALYISLISSTPDGGLAEIGLRVFDRGEMERVRRGTNSMKELVYINILKDLSFGNVHYRKATFPELNELVEKHGRDAYTEELNMLNKKYHKV